MRSLPLVLFAACAELAPFPPEDLEGLWVNAEEGEIRAFSFELVGTAPEVLDLPLAFALFSYPEGTEAAPVQRGTYDVAEMPLSAFDDAVHTALVQSVLWSVDGATTGLTLGNRLFAFGDDAFTLESSSAASGQRTFARAVALP